MEKLIFTLNGYTYERITKKVAKNLYWEDKPIYLLPSRANPFSPWVSMYDIYKKKCKNKPFGNVVAMYKFYNCNTELGNVVRYFKRIN